MIDATQQWKRLFEEEGVSPSDLARIFEVPLPRISEWLKRKKESTAVVCMWTYEKEGAKTYHFQRLKSNYHSSIKPPDCINVIMYSGLGLWGVLNLLRIKNAYINEKDKAK